MHQKLMKLRKNNNCTREKGEGKHARDKSQHAEASPHLTLPPRKTRKKKKKEGKGKLTALGTLRECHQYQ